MTEDLLKGLVIQIDPKVKCFGGAFGWISKCKNDVITAACVIPGKEGIAYVRLDVRNVHIVGQAKWFLPGMFHEE